METQMFIKSHEVRLTKQKKKEKEIRLVNVPGKQNNNYNF